ncbi:MAG: hypothetical protein ABII18_09000 [bacterium]|nr:hypothetical protein [bacterium]MBU1918456.1 hypothetical protein [bacterium]
MTQDLIETMKRSYIFTKHIETFPEAIDNIAHYTLLITLLFFFKVAIEKYYPLSSVDTLLLDMVYIFSFSLLIFIFKSHFSAKILVTICALFTVLAASYGEILISAFYLILFIFSVRLFEATAFIAKMKSENCT